MVDSTVPAALVPPIVGAIVLIIGTASAVYLNALKRRKAKIQKEQQQEESRDTSSTTDEENGIQLVEIEIDGEGDNVADSNPKDPPLLLPTVSAATCDFLSLTYCIFVVTAFVHGACLILTGLLQRDATSRVEDDSKQNFATTMGTLLVIGSSVGAAGIILTSLIPARGKGTTPHIVCGFIFFESALIWMTWTCLVTRAIGGSIALLVIRIILASLACAAMMWASKSTFRTMKLRNKEGVEDEWFQLMHHTSICQLSFGFVYAIFFATVAADF